MSTGTEAPAGLSTETGATGIRTQNLPGRRVRGHSREEAAFKARRTSPELSGGRRPDPDCGRLIPGSPLSGQRSGSRRGSALGGARVAGPLSPAEGQGPGERSLPSGNNDRSRALARARPARHGRRRRPIRSLRLRGPAAPPHRPPPTRPGRPPPPAASLTRSKLEAAVAAAAPQRALALLQDVVVLSLEELHAGPGRRGRRRRLRCARGSAAAARTGSLRWPGPPEPARFRERRLRKRPGCPTRGWRTRPGGGGGLGGLSPAPPLSRPRPRHLPWLLLAPPLPGHSPDFPQAPPPPRFLPAPFA